MSVPIPVVLPSSFPQGLDHLHSSRGLEGFVQRGDYAELIEDITKSPNDRNSYRIIRLKNGLEALLVQDPNADQPAASLSVRVGHLSDPETLPGLAHCLEHLLFMGSEKFPGENEYSSHLSQHTGWSNAFTAPDHTVYFFEVAQSGFPEALDRFAQFFIGPLFKESCVEREIKAVDSEHSKNLQNDGWRSMQLDRSLARDGHPYQKFGTGSLATLWDGPREKGIDIRAELIRFYETYYSANLMKLVIVSKESLDTSAARVAELFSGVANKNLPPQVFPGDVYDSSLHMTRTAVKTIIDYNALSIQFPFYDQSRLTGSRPGKLISHFLGHEGATSLFTFLKKKGLVNSLWAGVDDVAPGIDFFEISCSLTEAGLAQHQLVAAAIFEYIDLLRSQPLPQWAFEELKQLRARSFRFKEGSNASNVAVNLSQTLHNPWKRSDILSAPYTMSEMDPEEIKKALAYLIHDTCRVKVASKEAIKGLEFDQKERWYGTEYTVKPLDKEWFKTDKAVPSKFALPGPNPYMTSKLDLIGERDVEKPLPRPLCIKQTLGQRIWFKQDDRWKVPKASIWFKLSNPMIRSSYKNKTLCRFYVCLVNDALEEETYDAAVAGLGYGFSRGAESIQIQVSGYNDKLLTLLRVVLRKMKDLKVDEERFRIMKEEFLRDLDNESHNSPLKQIGAEISWLTSQHGHTQSETKEILESITAEAVQSFIPEVLSQFYMEALGHGNLHKTDMYEAVNLVEEVLGFDRLSREKLYRPKSRYLPEDCNYTLKLQASSKEEVNNGIDYWCHVGSPSDDALWVRLLLLSELMSEPCFDQLRTQEQLGYLVSSGIRSGASHIGLRIMIQSSSSPVHLEKRIDSFLEGFPEILKNKDVEAVKSGLATALQTDYKNQFEESASYWGEISTLYDFFYKERMLALLKPLKMDDILEFFMTYIHPSAANRSKLSVHLYSQQADPASIVELMKEHGVTSMLKNKMLVPDLKKVVEEQCKDIHACCKEEILRKVEDLGKIDGRHSWEIKELMPLGEPQEPVTDFYDGIAKL